MYIYICKCILFQMDNNLTMLNESIFRSGKMNFVQMKNFYLSYDK